jgi:hypothetical protein
MGQPAKDDNSTVLNWFVGCELVWMLRELNGDDVLVWGYAVSATSVISRLVGANWCPFLLWTTIHQWLHPQNTPLPSVFVDGRQYVGTKVMWTWTAKRPRYGKWF